MSIVNPEGWFLIDLKPVQLEPFNIRSPGDMAL